MDLVRSTSDLMQRMTNWASMSQADLKLEAAKAINERDSLKLWEMTEAHLTLTGQSGSTISPNTLRAYRRGVLDLINSWQDQNLLRPARDAGRLYVRKLEQTMKPSSVRVRLAAGKEFYSALRWAGVTEAAPFEDIKVTKDKTEAWNKRQPYSRDQLQKLLEIAKPLNQVIILLGSHAGLRASEIATLKWSNINLDSKYMQVLGKGRKIRRVRMSNSLATAVSALERKGELVVGLHTDSIRSRMTTLCKKAGVPYLALHSMRHSSGTRMYEETGDLGLVADHLGHSSIDTTRIYAKIADKRLERTVGEW
jgi:integrase